MYFFEGATFENIYDKYLSQLLIEMSDNILNNYNRLTALNWQFDNLFTTSKRIYDFDMVKQQFRIKN